MCELCASDREDRERAKREVRSLAEMLRGMARDLERMANGRIKPHGEQAKTMGIKARAIIRRLAADWM